jgi:hypothetical protein
MISESVVASGSPLHLELTIEGEKTAIEVVPEGLAGEPMDGDLTIFASSLPCTKGAPLLGGDLLCEDLLSRDSSRE